MSISWKIPRNCLAWLLLAQIGLILPHVFRLPLWVLGAYTVCAIWRIMVFQGRWSFPHSIIKALLALACFGGIYSSYGSFLGLEAMVALLFSGLSLKLLEVVNKRDVYVILFLSYFVAITEFLFNQDFLVTCLVFLSAVFITTSLVALHQQAYDQISTVSLRKAATLFSQALPLMVVLFVVFPRFAPLWNVPTLSNQAKTGISDSMSPGDIAQLAQSDELAFRVNFDSDIPPTKAMYWRGLVLSDFDGRSWRQTQWRSDPLNKSARREHAQKLVNPIKYRITQEATFQPWLFAIALASSRTQGIVPTQDLRLVRTKAIHERIQYDVASDLTAVLDPNLDRHAYDVLTRLPAFGDKKSRAFAASLLKQSVDTNDYINKVLTHFREQAFFYTLKPPMLGKNSIDEFLFKTRQGFCSHYASSFVFLMRSAGIAARVVAGYQGGELNPVSKSVLVHQFDAHAWAEVWINKQGWVQVDPTAAVSPERIEQGLQRAMREQGGFLSDRILSPLRYRHLQWLNTLRLQMDALSYYWQSAVLQYQGDRQLRLLKTLLGEVTPWRVAGLLLTVGFIVMALVAFSLFSQRSNVKAAEPVRVYLRLCKRLERAGFKRAVNEGPIDFARRITHKKPVWAAHFNAATRVFVMLTYAPIESDQTADLLKQLKNQSKKISYYLHRK